jgi:hypothetical protein
LSMIGNYRRISEASLEEILANPEKLSAILYPDDDTDGAPHLDIDKSWHIIHFLLNGETWTGEWPLIGAVLGGAEVSEENVGYGPARYLRPGEVAQVARALQSVTPDLFWSQFDANAVREADLYPQGLWSDTAVDKEYITGNYEKLVDFFTAANRANEAVLLYIS